MPEQKQSGIRSDNFRYAIDIVFRHEGGYSDHPNDKGGKTNMGITQTTYNDYCKRHNLKPKDIKNITKSEAIQIYYDDYWRASGADKLENPVEALVLFDTAVLHGVGRAKSFYKSARGDINKVLDLRKDFYAKRVQQDPSQKVFLKGWNNRVNNLEKILKESQQK